MSVRPNNRIEIIDYLRFAAALSVACFHYYTNGFLNGKVPLPAPDVPVVLHYGYLGVHLFFLISGFVIIQSAQRHPVDRFLIARIVRLWPAFILCMTLTAITQIFWATPGMSTTPEKYIANITMVPEFFGVQPIDGAYWTLFYEIAFYGMMLFVIMLGLRSRLNLVLEVWLALIVVNWVLPFSDAKLLHPYNSLFVAGAICGLAFNASWSIRKILGFSFALFVAATFAYQFVSHPDHVAPWLAAATVLTFGFIIASCTFKRVRTWKLPFARALGEISYPYYLLHAHLGYMAIFHLGSPQTLYWLIPAVLLAMLLGSAVVHYCWELRTRRWFYSKLDIAVGKPIRWLSTLGGSPSGASQS